MSDHIMELLGAYLDGELHGRQLHNVEAHLNECELCQAELESLQALSGILHEAPAAEFPSAERFASNVNLRLARRPEVPLRRKALEFGWWMMPVGFLLAWIFVNTVILVNNVVMAADGIGLLDDKAAWLTSTSEQTEWSAALSEFGLLQGNGLQWAETVEAASRTAIPGIFWQVSIALLYLGWMAIWWTRQTRREPDQLLDGGGRPTVK